jgi:hypothetical protein
MLKVPYDSISQKIVSDDSAIDGITGDELSIRYMTMILESIKEV